MWKEQHWKLYLRRGRASVVPWTGVRGMKKEKIKTLLIEPLMAPRIAYLEPSMRAFRKAVKADTLKYGDVEAKKLEKNVYAIFNKDRFLCSLDSLKPNRRIGDDIIIGNIYIVAIDDKRFPVSLTDNQISTYALRFWNPEEFDDMDVIEANCNTLFSRFLIDEDS
jgi:hypothetical protein